MKKVDFCFFVTETFVDAHRKVLIAKEMENRGYSTFFITTSDAGDAVFKAAGLNNFVNLDVLCDEIKDPAYTPEDIAKVEESFSILNLRAEILTELLVFKFKKEEEVLALFMRYLKALKKLLEESLQATYFVQGMSGSLNSFAFYHAAKRVGKHVYFSGSPFSGLFHFSFHHWGIFEINGEKIKQGISSEERAWTEDFLSKMKKERKPNLPMSQMQANPYITGDRIKTFFRLLKTSRAEHLPLFFLLKNFGKRYLRRYYVRKFYQAPIAGEKYIYFPLHFPDDSQLTVRGLPFITQEFVVEIISRHLPSGYTLYVKEHPASMGYFSVKMLRYLAKLPNVKIVSPLLNSYDLIENARAVCVINSTVGFEALMFPKPVITFGASFYRDKGVTLDVHDLYELPEIMRKALTFQPDWERILILFYLWHKNSFPPAPQETLYTDSKPDSSKISIFCDSLLGYLETER
ncbi:MAG: hypothetical protein HYV77_01670 [Candidatus Wildermuthbacteria bacterium]|nr:hypothetical protein [Candidatus Wildermuthbacteria bacterium]